MRHCAGHARALCDGIDRRGLSRLVGGVVNDAGARFDPLATIETLIWYRAIELWGFRAMMRNPEGTERCPLCEADRREGRNAGLRWIGMALDLALRHAVENGFVDASRPRFEFALVQ